MLDCCTQRRLNWIVGLSQWTAPRSTRRITLLPPLRPRPRPRRRPVLKHPDRLQHRGDRSGRAASPTGELTAGSPAMSEPNGLRATGRACRSSCRSCSSSGWAPGRRPEPDGGTGLQRRGHARSRSPFGTERTAPRVKPRARLHAAARRRCETMFRLANVYEGICRGRAQRRSEPASPRAAQWAAS